MSQHAIATALLVQRDALRFAEADADANMELDWDEFYSMQPKRVSVWPRQALCAVTPC